MIKHQPLIKVQSNPFVFDRQSKSLDIAAFEHAVQYVESDEGEQTPTFGSEEKLIIHRSISKTDFPSRSFSLIEGILDPIHQKQLSPGYLSQRITHSRDCRRQRQRTNARIIMNHTIHPLELYRNDEVGKDIQKRYSNTFNSATTHGRLQGM